jgi:hypothetical protein
MNKIGKLSVINGLICVTVLTLLLAYPLKSNAADYCALHAKKQCISNIVYWYNSCGVLEDVYQNCNTTNQICQNAQCVNKTTDQNTVIQNQTTTNQSATNQTAISQNQIQNGNLIISIFGKKESEPLQWDKNISATDNDKINFLLIVKNSSDLPIDNVSVKTDVTNNIAYANDLKIDNLSLAGDIVSGVDLGTIALKTSKIISFTGSIMAQTNQVVAQITANINSGNMLYDSDYLTINIANKPTVNTATVAPDNFITRNLKKNWYIWIIIIILLIVVFIIIFRKLSSNV